MFGLFQDVLEHDEAVEKQREMTKTVKADGTTFYTIAIGIGSVDHGQLDELAVDDSHVFYVEEIDLLYTVAVDVIGSICKPPEPSSE